MADLIVLDRSAMLDLTTAISILTEMVRNPQPPTDELNNKIKYVNKLVLTSMASFEKHNP